MKKLLGIFNFLKSGLTIRNLFISISGGVFFLFLMFLVQLFYRGSIDLISWNNDLIFPILLGAATSLAIFEKKKKIK